MARLLCDRCKRKCRGDVLRVANKYFHKSCFTCTICSQSLETGGFFIKDEKFYCQADYQKYFSAKCKACSKELGGEIVTVLHFSFHRECFKCTTCSIAFNPGDRVTIWKEQFFCPNCIKSQQIPLSPPTQNGKGAGTYPPSYTDDEGCVSAADASPSDVPTTGQDSKYVKLESTEKLCLTSPDPKCIISISNPQKSKSILRKANGHITKIAPGEHAYLSNDSGLGEKLFDSRTHNDTLQLSIPEQTNGNDSYTRFMDTPSTTISGNFSRQSLLSRVPNSDYGRYLNQSYMHLSQPVLSPTAYQYKQSVPTPIATNFSKPKHFHIPEAKSRFLPPGTKFASVLLRQPSGSLLSQLHNPRAHANSTPKHVTTSAFDLSKDQRLVNGKPADIKQVASNGIEPSPGDEHDATLEVRRLACYPGGHARDKTLPTPIERLDWPAPPASAVVLAELMRERRFRDRDQSRPDGDEFQSQEALSIDESTDVRSGGACGIGKAIMMEEANQKRRCQSQLLDPVSSSRSPNAATEPGYKPRFSTHQFACQPVRPGYTGGRLFGLDKSSSLPASSLLLDHGRRADAAVDASWQAGSTVLPDSDATTHPNRRIATGNHPYYHSIHALSTLQPHLSNGVAHRLQPSSSSLIPNRADNEQSDPRFLKCQLPAPKIIPYDELRTYRDKTPKGIDRTALERHLSEEEFQRVFQLSRPAFYHLPEWKRNDLKRRVELF